MKSYLLIIPVFLLLGSCSGWDSEHKDLFHQGCMEDLKDRGMTEEKAKSICDCRLEIAMKKFPDVADAFEHIDVLVNDPELQKCK